MSQITVIIIKESIECVLNETWFINLCNTWRPDLEISAIFGTDLHRLTSISIAQKEVVKQSTMI